MQVKPALRANGQQVSKTVKTHMHTCIQKSNKLCDASLASTYAGLNIAAFLIKWVCPNLND